MSSLQLIPGNREVVYDYSPFLTSTTITSRLSPLAGPTAITIPETDLVSPLAANISPDVVSDMRSWLTGCSLDGRPLPPAALSLSGRWTGPGSSLGREKGEEIWRAWKRAWDLWNGHYIEGRVDSVWVREEYERIKHELEEARKKSWKSPSKEKEKEKLPKSPNPNWDQPIEEDGMDVDLLTGRSDEMDVDVDESYMMSRFADRSPPQPKIRPAAEVKKCDGSTGGFVPMKLLSEYVAPDTDEGGNYPEGWEDVLANTVWWPRRTGEKEGEVQVGIDEPWGKKNEFEFDGGVDCGRSPYPCLRYVIEYVQREGCFLKKKVWDQVTGTIFNMPTLPVNPSEITDEHRIRVDTLFGDFFRDNALQNRNFGYFPLDIMRIDKVDPITRKRQAGTPLVEDGESLLKWPWNNPEGSLLQLEKDDPWYVTDEQQERQLVPPRKYPPGKLPCANGDTILPTDDTIWKEEVENDERYRSRYFVTNLHGGLLVINGQEVKLGEIAGPLPEFAVIETPGNQVSFWFGPQGRNWKGPLVPRLHTKQWRAMRQNPGWRHIALTAGQVWDFKIRDRLRREYMGADQNDDAQWAAWKTAVAKEIPQTTKPSPLDVAICDFRYGPSPAEHKQTPEEAQLEFSTEEEELEWLITKALPLKQVTLKLETDNIIQARGDSFWPGPETSEGPDVTHSLIAQKRWADHKDQILEQQRDINAELAEERDSRAAAKKQRTDAENKKRKAESPEGPAAKRARTEAEAQSQAAIAAATRHEAARAAQQLEQDKQIEEAEQKEAAEKKAEDDARLAAETRQAIEADQKRLADLNTAEREKAEKELAERTRIEHEQKKSQEVWEKEQAIIAHNQSKIDQGLPPNPETSPSTDEQKQQEEQKRKQRLARLEAQRKRDELVKKHAEEREAKRKEAELKKERQEQKRREEADRKREEKEEAERQRQEKTEKELEAATNARREKFQADREKALLKELSEKRKKREEENKTKKEREERDRRETLFQDKYGVPPDKNDKLDAMGNRVKKDDAPPANPSPTLEQRTKMAFMSDEEVNEFLERESFKLSTSKQLTTEELNNYNLQLAIELSLGGLVDEFTLAISGSTVLRAIQNSRQFEEAKERLQQRAKSEGVSVTKYAQNQGHTDIAGYMEAELLPAKPEGFPTLSGNRDSTVNVLLTFRYWIRRDARKGLVIRARLENRSVEDIVREKGYANLEVYLRTLENSLIQRDVESNILNDWAAFCQRVTDAAEWDARITSLPLLAPAKTNRSGQVFAEL